MKNYIQKGLFSIIALSVVSFGVTQTAFAHVTVKPGESVTAGFQTFTVSVPNEKEIPTVAIRLVMPEGLKYVTPTVKNGWKITTEKVGSGEAANVSEINWTEGSVGNGLRDEFTFAAQVPETQTELKWKAYQTYSDGTVVSWDKESKGDDHSDTDENSGPLSVTKVVGETEAMSIQNKVEKSSNDAKIAADRALYASIAAIVLSLGSIAFATRKRN